MAERKKVYTGICPLAFPRQQQNDEPPGSFYISQWFPWEKSFKIYFHMPRIEKAKIYFD